MACRSTTRKASAPIRWSASSTRGRWQEGLLPQIGISDDDRRQYDEFFARMDHSAAMRGSDGRPAFAIPLDLSSRDPALLALDRDHDGRMDDAARLDSEPLRWYVDYSCRDDYGAGHRASLRVGRAALLRRAPRPRRQRGSDAVVTWPEGNGWLAQQLAAPSRAIGSAAAASCSNRCEDGGVVVDYFDLARNESVRVRARGVVCAAPRFVAQRIVRDLPPSARSNIPRGWSQTSPSTNCPTGRGAPLAWDNVLRGQLHRSATSSPPIKVSARRRARPCSRTTGRSTRAARARNASARSRALTRIGASSSSPISTRCASRNRRAHPQHRRLALGPRHDPSGAGFHLGRNAPAHAAAARPRSSSRTPT